MATKTRTIRAAAATWALVDAEAQRIGESPNAVAANILHDYLSGHGREPEPAPAPAELPPKATRALAALVKAEARTGVTRAHLDTSMVPVHDGSKRPAYQKTGGPKAAGRGRGR